MRFTISFVAALVAAVSASNVVDLVPENFDEFVGKGKPGLVELYVE
jgi:protein disulfide-isomerase A6